MQNIKIYNIYTLTMLLFKISDILIVFKCILYIIVLFSNILYIEFLISIIKRVRRKKNIKFKGFESYNFKDKEECI
jgi:hypothetical protein